MAVAFSRKQILLRREDGTPAGFLRLEMSEGRCCAEVKLSGVTGDARALMLRPEDGAPCQLGSFQHGKGSVWLSAEDAKGCTQVAVLSGDKLLLVGGDGADFAAIRRRLARPVRRHGPERKRALQISTWGEERKAPEEKAVVETEIPIDACRAPHPLEKDGWAIVSNRAEDAPERVSGKAAREGQPVLELVGVAGAYAPEPPPGLTGFTWDTGYWVRVREAVVKEG